MSRYAIEVQGIGKQYRIGEAQYHNTLRDVISDSVGNTARRLRGHRPPRQKSESTIWALRDISFEVEQGGTVGIIGRNGSGKSTLLKILSQITEPTEGRVAIHGRVSALLEVGTGFHPELTGRENVYLNGAVLGMSKLDIDRRFEEIVSFAEIETFLDTPVKRYSSGMYMRLAFAVSAHLEPDVLLVDEVLAVGDAVFQRKCIGKMNSVAREGRTVLFVSHNMAPVVQLCDTAIWLDTGSIVQQGPTRDVVSLYMTSDASTEGECRWPEGIADPGVDDFKFLSVRALNHRGEVSGTIDASHPMSIEIEYEILRELPYCRVGFWFSNVDGVVIFEAHDADFDERLAGTRPPGRYVARCEIPANTLVPVRYIISVNAGMPPMRRLARVEGALTLDVDTSAGTSIKRFYGLIRPPLFWDTEVNEGVAAS